MDNSKNEQIVEINHDRLNYSIYLPHSKNDYIQKTIKIELKPYELEMLADLTSRCKADDLIVDIGANIGNHSLYIAAKGYEVVAFEPNSDLASALKFSVKINNWEQKIVVHQVGVGAEKGNAHFDHIDEDNLGGMSLTVSEGDIDIIALDDFHFEKTPSILKIDVEGMELDVLRGARKLLSNHHPILYVECLNEEEFRSVNIFLQEFDYAYCDTFNASPTHLFINSNDLTGEELSRHISFKQELNTYKSNAKLDRIINDINRNIRATNSNHKFQVNSSTLTEKNRESLVKQFKLIESTKALFIQTSSDNKTALNQALNEISSQFKDHARTTEAFLIKKSNDDKIKLDQYLEDLSLLKEENIDLKNTLKDNISLRKKIEVLNQEVKFLTLNNEELHREKSILHKNLNKIRHSVSHKLASFLNEKFEEGGSFPFIIYRSKKFYEGLKKQFKKIN